MSNNSIISFFIVIMYYHYLCYVSLLRASLGRRPRAAEAGEPRPVRRGRKSAPLTIPGPENVGSCLRPGGNRPLESIKLLGSSPAISRFALCGLGVATLRTVR